MIYNFQPSNPYKLISKRIPDSFYRYELVLIHYKDEKFVSKRWTTRTRDIIKKHSTMLQFDNCNAYLFEPTRFKQFDSNINSNMILNKSFMFLAYRLCGDRWVSTVDQFDFEKVCQVEHYPISFRQR